MTELISAELLSSDEPVAFFGYARAKQGLEQELADRMRALGTPSRQEPGVLVYESHRDAAQPGAVAFYELYANGAAVKSHLDQPHMQNFFADCPALLASDLEISVLRPLH
jgi:quinol monooxygenase YgiN